MSDEKRDQADLLGHDLSLDSGASCTRDAEGHCVTCSDEALPAMVLRVDEEAGLALVSVKDTTEEIDITLVERAVPGDLLLVHGGAAIAHLGSANGEK
jgi:hydrogenase maturation factor